MRCSAASITTSSQQGRWLHSSALCLLCVLCLVPSLLLRPPPSLPPLLLQVESEGGHSSWNVDGELLRHGRVNVGIHAGLVDVFARGVELM